MLSPTKDFSSLLSDFPVLFKADLIFKDNSRKPSKFKYFSSMCEPCISKIGFGYNVDHLLGKAYYYTIIINNIILKE